MRNRWHLLRILRLAPTGRARLIRFLMYNLVMALLPFVISWLTRLIADVPAPSGVYAAEWLFFGIMISATALGDIADEVKLAGSSSFFQLIRGLLIFGGSASAALFGMYQYDQIIGPGNSVFRLNIGRYALVLAGSLFVTSLIPEILISRLQGDKQ